MKFPLKYPETKKIDGTDTYFETVVEDPYRWLENDTSQETKDWVKAQNEVTFGFLNKLPGRGKIRKRLAELLDYPKYGVPFKKAGKYFFFKNDGLQDQSVLFMCETLDVEPRVIIDPNTFSENGTVSLTSVEVSEDGKYLVYMVASSGSDWNEIYVKNIETGETLKDHLEWVKFSDLSWFDGGFYYSAYDKPTEGQEFLYANEFQKVYYHKLGASQSEDVLIIEDKENRQRMFSAGVTEDKHFLAITISESTSGNALSVKNLTKESSEIVPVMTSTKNDFTLIGNVGDELFILTNYKAPKYRLLKVDINNSVEKYWMEVIQEEENVLERTTLAGNRIVATYMKDAHSELAIYSYNGEFERSIQLPGIGSVDSFRGKKDENIAFYDYTSFNTPGEIYQFDFERNESRLFFRPEVKFNSNDYEVKQKFFESKDGTRLPMFIIHKRGMKLDGKNPTLLYGYGGFNISLTPSFSAIRMAFIEKGGVFALANLRGGGEYGEDWHLAGTKFQKQNVFDDFIAAAEYLIQSNYTDRNHLAIQGGSNGGLLVGAVLNQRPDLFKVALPAVGVMDMLRYQKFTIGWAWASDYGTSADSKEMFEYLYKYSPYHNIIKDGKYPAVLVTTADHDDRVVPAHSFKYIARLQEFNKGELPVLIRIDTDAGHGSGKPTSKVIEEYGDILAYVYFHLGIELK